MSLQMRRREIDADRQVYIRRHDYPAETRSIHYQHAKLTIKKKD